MQEEKLMAFPISAALLDAIVLSIVSREGTYGYKITQDIRKVCDMSESTLYPVLGRLLKAGDLDTYDQALDVRMRRYYKITPQGRMHLVQYLADWAAYRDKIESVFFGGRSHERI